MILVTGGAGYIGSHTVLALAERGDAVLVLDDLSEGHAAALRGQPLAQGTLSDPDFVDSVFAKHPIQAVIHFAARCYVGESMRAPAIYWQQNLGNTIHLLDSMSRHGVSNIVFSSTCATYGLPKQVPITETAEQRPVNVYGHTKLACEQLLRDFHGAFGISSVALRYFNAAGADPQGRLGESHYPETHLIPLAIDAAAGRGQELEVFGTDYETPDGTCIRDYVHVTDLASAHLAALDALLDDSIQGAEAFNVGAGQGVSVREVLDTTAEVMGRPVPHRIAARREGDPPVLVGDASLARQRLQWSPQHSDLSTILRTAAAWRNAHPHGYSPVDSGREP